MTKTGGRDRHVRVMNDVIAVLVSAQKKLDEINAPGDVGAHLDTAICRLREINGK